MAGRASFFSETRQETEETNFTHTYLFMEDIDYRGYKSQVEKKIEEFGLSKDLAIFDDNKKSILFSYFSQIEIAYIFNVGPIIRSKGSLTMFMSQVTVLTDEKHENYLRAKRKEMTDNSAAYSQQYYHFIQESAETSLPLTEEIEQLPELTLAAALELLRSHKFYPKHVVISEAHHSTFAKIALLDPASINLLIEQKGIVLLEHLCSESMQTELDNCLLKRTLSPLLIQFLVTLDKCHDVPKDAGFYSLVKTLIEAGIPVIAADNQAAYSYVSEERMSDVVPEKRQTVNVEWKRKADLLRQSYPESLVVSLIGFGHTSIAMNAHKGHYSFPMIGYDEMIDGAHWPINAPGWKNKLVYQSQPFQFKPVAVVEAIAAPVLTTAPSHSKYENTLILTHMMRKNLVFKKEANECEMSCNKITSYADGTSSSRGKDIFTLGRLPQSLVPSFCEKFDVNPANLTQEPSAYKGQSDNTVHVNLKIKKSDLDRLLSLEPARLKKAADEIHEEVNSVRNRSSFGLG